MIEKETDYNKSISRQSLQAGQIYVYHYGEGEHYCIGQCTESGSDYCWCIKIETDDKPYRIGGNKSQGAIRITAASPAQREYLKECRKQNKALPLEYKGDCYEIY